MGKGGYIGGHSIIRVEQLKHQKNDGWFEHTHVVQKKKKKRPLVASKKGNWSDHKINKKRKVKRPSDRELAFNTCDQKKLEANLRFLKSQREEILKQIQIGLISKLDYAHRRRLTVIDRDISVIRSALEKD